MPELPEVETVVRGLRPALVGKSIREAWSDWPRVLQDWDLPAFDAAVRGCRVESLHRRGKYICFAMGRWAMVIHLRMTGRLYTSYHQRGQDPWVHFSLLLDDGAWLNFSDSRKFGRVVLANDLGFLEAKLGPEPLDVSATELGALVRGSRRAVKTFLLDQKKVAGIGNIYADEALFLAGIAPIRPVDSLSARERDALGSALQKVLSAGIEHEGASVSWYRKPDGGRGESQKHFNVYGRGGQPCLRCGTPVRRCVVGQRGTHFCPRCQRGSSGR